MRPIILIPARLGATRLPDKPLADINGLPMIVHVVRRAEAADLGPVVVAAAEPAIVEAVTAHGGRAVLTDPALPSGSDRVHAAANLVDPERDHDVIVNLQGDLPTIDPATLQACLAPLVDEAVQIGTAAAPIDVPGERESPSVVKIAMAPGEVGEVRRAHYFSRGAIPFGEGPSYHHIGLYAFRRAALDRFVGLPPSPLEQRERLEQLRALEHGMPIGVAIVARAVPGVDTAADLDAARAALGKTGGSS